MKVRGLEPSPVTSSALLSLYAQTAKRYQTSRHPSTTTLVPSLPLVPSSPPSPRVPLLPLFRRRDVLGRAAC